MHPRKYKPYKNCQPVETLRRIRDILSNHGIQVCETVESNLQHTFFAAHLILSNDGVEPMGLVANGKGRSREYALASAYGELMERLQSGIMLPHRTFIAAPFCSENKWTLPTGLHSIRFYFAPDEKILRGREKNEALKQYVRIESIEYAQNHYQSDFEIALPFFNASSKRIDYIPQRILEHTCGSNGMAAGNTLLEAILQGTFEIFERYALRKLYEEKLTPPNIPLDFFKGSHTYEAIRNLIRNKGYEVIIKDCSVGMNIPVIGVIIIDRKNGRYDFHLGADSVPEIALERVFSELYQDSSCLKLKPFEVSVMVGMLSNKQLAEDQRVRYSFKDNQLPASLFYSHPSYPVQWIYDNQWGESDDKDLAICVKLLQEHGFNMYIRNVSFMDFPSVIIYIPGMSELADVESMRWFKATFEHKDQIALLSHQLTRGDHKKILELLRLISKFKRPSFLEAFNYMDVWHKGNSLFVLGVLAMVVEEYDKAIIYFDKALYNTNADELRHFYSLFRDYAVVMNHGSSALTLLSKLYSEEEITLVEDCIRNDGWKTKFNLSQCFECEVCRFAQGCTYRGYTQFLKRREAAYMDNLPDQNKLSEYLKIIIHDS